MQKITPCLWFDDQAEEAVRFYTSIFKNSKVVNVTRYGEAGQEFHGKAGKVMTVAFLIYWIRFTYPRLREDQLQAVAWKFLIPLSLLNILVTAVFKVAF